MTTYTTPTQARAAIETAHERLVARFYAAIENADVLDEAQWQLDTVCAGVVVVELPGANVTIELPTEQAFVDGSIEVEIRYDWKEGTGHSVRRAQQLGATLTAAAVAARVAREHLKDSALDYHQQYLQQRTDDN